jgi:hypothetical protein
VEKLKKIIKFVDIGNIRKITTKKIGGTKIMGMSASQMRFCMITGRKSDVEYEGQQINQQRTTLASESSIANEQLLNLSVPTPPSTDDYSTTIYTYSSGGNTYTITGASLNSDNTTYTLNTSAELNTDSAVKGALSTFTSATNSSGETIYKDSSGNIYSASDTSNTTTASALATIYGDDYNADADGDGNADETYYQYTNSSNVTRYISASQLSKTADTTNQGEYYYLTTGTTTATSSITNANVNWSDSGRMESFYTITTTTTNGATSTSTSSTTSLTCATSTDENAYNDAYNEYEYQKEAYNQDVTSINSKICVIENEDKKLELKLKNLDTQQEALSTEMDSVKKVIDKNIESSFKTFA